MKKTKITKKQPTSPTFDSLYLLFIEEKKAQGVSESTLKNYHDTYLKFKEFCPSGTISKQTIYGFINQLQFHYASVASVNHYISHLRAIVYFCFENGIEAEKFKISLVKGQETVKQIYTDEEIKRLLEKPSADCSFSEYRNWLIVQTLLGTGIRAASLINIQLKDLYLPNKQLILAHTKNKKAQIVPLSTSLVKNLKEYISLYRDANNPDEYLFVSVYDEPMNYNTLRLAITRYNHSRGVAKTSIHLFRHTFATTYIKAGGSGIALQQLLGHSTMQMTRKYVSLYAEDLSRNFDDLCPLEAYIPKGKKHSIK